MAFALTVIRGLIAAYVSAYWAWRYFPQRCTTVPNDTLGELTEWAKMASSHGPGKCQMLGPGICDCHTLPGHV
jgi:hypothetical protein